MLTPRQKLESDLGEPVLLKITLKYARERKQVSHSPAKGRIFAAARGITAAQRKFRPTFGASLGKNVQPGSPIQIPRTIRPAPRDDL